MSLISTAPISGRISAAWSALYRDVMNARAPQSETMYDSSPLVRRDEQAVYTSPA